MTPSKGSATPPSERRSHHGEQIAFGGVVSYYADFCWRFGENPDLNELQRYNEQAKARECQHERLRFIAHDDGGGRYICESCELSKDPNWQDKFVRCPRWHSEYSDRCKKCGGLGLLPKGLP